MCIDPTTRLLQSIVSGRQRDIETMQRGWTLNVSTMTGKAMELLKVAEKEGGKAN